MLQPKIFEKINGEYFTKLFKSVQWVYVKTAEPIGPKFFVATNMSPGKVSGW